MLAPMMLLLWRMLQGDVEIHKASATHVFMHVMEARRRSRSLAESHALPLHVATFHVFMRGLSP